MQIDADADLIARGVIDGARWHFFRGASPEIEQYLTTRASFIRSPLMDYNFFETLSSVEAERHLTQFLDVEHREVRLMLEQLDGAEIGVAYSPESILHFFESVREHVTVHIVEPPEGTPAWLVEATKQDHGGFRALDEESQILALRAAFYLGQTLVSTYPGLSWALGRPGRAEFQQPVVTGLRSDLDLAPLAIAENMLKQRDDDAFRTRVTTAVKVWRESV
ncbi:hypothetical protein AB0L40_27150 [Patulibacter sp. NPDC049589]|uniref:hypothetical protein n=1 Tax=Patulibacter sp. NPDC049589 TaxID=3154731 RepID=UPI003415A6CF